MHNENTDIEEKEKSDKKATKRKAPVKINRAMYPFKKRRIGSLDVEDRRMKILKRKGKAVDNTQLHPYKKNKKSDDLSSDYKRLVSYKKWKI